MVVPRSRLCSCATTALLLFVPAAGGQTFDEPEPVSAPELIFLLQYVAADYQNAVQGAHIIDDFEYREMRDLSQRILDRFDVLRENGASEAVRAELVQLATLIRRAARLEEVRNLASGLVTTLLEELDLALLPMEAQDLERGAELYLHSCAACHGSTGAGDGPSSPGMDPPPTSFRDSRMNSLSPHQIQGAVSFGTYGTAMPSYRQVLTQREIWSISFYTMTLREDFDPRPPEKELPLTLADLAVQSNVELLASALRARPDIEPAHIDYYRQNPPAAVGSAERD